jgi:transcriptional regulator with XRE-family HTH domain
MEKFESVLGRVLAEQRRRVGLSQEALAYRCKLHPTYISQLERGLKSPTIRVLITLSAALDVRPSDLLRAAEEHGSF